MTDPLRIEETTVATVHGWRVTVGNILDGTVEIGLYDEKKKSQGEPTLSEGAELVIAGHRYRVARIVGGQGGDNGYVELQRI